MLFMIFVKSRYLTIIRIKVVSFKISNRDSVGVKFLIYMNMNHKVTQVFN